MLSTCAVDWMCVMRSQFEGLHVIALRLGQLYQLVGSCHRTLLIGTWALPWAVRRPVGPSVRMDSCSLRPP